MNIQVVSREDIYVEGKRIELKRLFFDGYVNHTRDVFIHGDVVIKLDVVDQGVPSSEWDYPGYNQSALEVERWGVMSKPERRFFQPPISHGYFIEYERRVHWIAQEIVMKTNAPIHDHKDFNRFSNICRWYDIWDAFCSENTCVNDAGKLICFDWAL